MDIPGEKLVIKLWQTLADNAVGGLLAPWQTKRLGQAQVEVRRREKLLLAQTERDVEDIQKGIKKVEQNGSTLRLLPNATEVIDGRAEPSLDVGVLLTKADARKQADALREEVNTANTIIQAEGILRDNSAPIPDDSIEPDWLYRWRDCAGKVSDQQMQSLWAKVLAGEVVSPGFYSLRCLEFLRNLTRIEAEKIQRFCPFVLDGQFIALLGEMATKPDGDLGDELELQEIGIVSGVGGAGLTRTFGSNGTGSGFLHLIMTHGRAIVVRSDDHSKRMQIPVYRLTPLGREVVSLNKAPAPETYLRAVAGSIKAQGFMVSLAHTKPVFDPQPGTLFFDEIEL